MYHDQALIPIKTSPSTGGVNVTLGLPFVRTSPDHGTAFDIAGRGRPTRRACSPRCAWRRWRLAATARRRSGCAVSAADGLPPLREVIARHGLGPQEALGQNFLLDLNLTGAHRARGRRLTGVTVIEVGPGPGGLTRALLAEGAARWSPSSATSAACRAGRDRRAYPGRLEVSRATRWRSTGRARAARASSPTCPTTSRPPLLVGWLTAEPWPPFYESLTLMFQREVAERIVAAPGAARPTAGSAVLANGARRRGSLFDMNAARLHPAAQGHLLVVVTSCRAPSRRAARLRRKLERVTAPPSASAARCCAAAALDAARRQRHVGGDADDRPARSESAIHMSAASAPLSTTTMLHQRMRRRPQAAVGDEGHRRRRAARRPARFRRAPGRHRHRRRSSA
jgi:hypothetical protein